MLPRFPSNHSPIQMKKVMNANDKIVMEEEQKSQFAQHDVPDVIRRNDDLKKSDPNIVLLKKEASLKPASLQEIKKPTAFS